MTTPQQCLFILLGCLLLGSILASPYISGDECSDLEEAPRLILCYVSSNVTFPNAQVDVCRCTHLIVPFGTQITQNNGNLTLDEELKEFLRVSRRRSGGRLRRILSLPLLNEDIDSLPSKEIVASVEGLVDNLIIDGIEVDWQQPIVGDHSKKNRANLAQFIKEIHALFQEKVIVTANLANRTIIEGEEIDATRPSILLRLPTVPENLVKGYDLKALTKTVDLFVVDTSNISDFAQSNVTYHHSRLMGLSDISNTDSILDLVISLGVPGDMLVAAIPTFATSFQLIDFQQTIPGSPTSGGPSFLSSDEVCAMMKEGNWTVERDDDLTGTYAYSDEGEWIAFDDQLAAQIKAKYFLLREIAGVALMTVDMDSTGHCGMEHEEEDSGQPMTITYYENFFFLNSGERTRRHLVESLQDDLSASASTLSSPVFPSTDRIRVSPYRIVRVVDRSGKTSVVRQSQETSLRCSRQGFYRHPEDCSRFYRCVKFDQYVDDFTVFEYDCPDGLVFDEKWEVCTWPSQAAPCGGSSEIQPVPSQKFVCPGEGYFADPENCRWFFACRDYARDGVTFTQFEFRCPFGLLFDEENLLCNWPWLVPQCSAQGSGSKYVGNTASSSNTQQQQYQQKSTNIGVGSPGYLAGKLVTGEGLYKDPRLAHHSESVVSAGCLDCESGSMIVRDPAHSNPSYPSKPTHHQPIFISADKVVGDSNPVRVVTGSPDTSSYNAYTTTAIPRVYESSYPFQQDTHVNQKPSATIQRNQDRTQYRPTNYDQLSDRPQYKPSNYEQQDDHQQYKPSTYEQQDDRQQYKPSTYQQQDDRQQHKIPTYKQQDDRQQYKPTYQQQDDRQQYKSSINEEQTDRQQYKPSTSTPKTQDRQEYKTTNYEQPNDRHQYKPSTTTPKTQDRQEYKISNYEQQNGRQQYKPPTTTPKIQDKPEYKTSNSEQHNDQQLKKPLAAYSSTQSYGSSMPATMSHTDTRKPTGDYQLPVQKQPSSATTYSSSPVEYPTSSIRVPDDSITYKPREQLHFPKVTENQELYERPHAASGNSYKLPSQVNGANKQILNAPSTTYQQPTSTAKYISKEVSYQSQDQFSLDVHDTSKYKKPVETYKPQYVAHSPELQSAIPVVQQGEIYEEKTESIRPYVESHIHNTPQKSQQPSANRDESTSALYSPNRGQGSGGAAAFSSYEPSQMNKPAIPYRPQSIQNKQDSRTISSGTPAPYKNQLASQGYQSVSSEPFGKVHYEQALEALQGSNAPIPPCLLAAYEEISSEPTRGPSYNKPQKQELQPTSYQNSPPTYQQESTVLPANVAREGYKERGHSKPVDSYDTSTYKTPSIKNKESSMYSYIQQDEPQGDKNNSGSSMVSKGGSYDSNQSYQPKTTGYQSISNTPLYTSPVTQEKQTGAKQSGSVSQTDYKTPPESYKPRPSLTSSLTYQQETITPLSASYSTENVKKSIADNQPEVAVFYQNPQYASIGTPILSRDEVVANSEVDYPAVTYPQPDEKVAVFYQIDEEPKPLSYNLEDGYKPKDRGTIDGNEGGKVLGYQSSSIGSPYHNPSGSALESGHGSAIQKSQGTKEYKKNESGEPKLKTNSDHSQRKSAAEGSSYGTSETRDRNRKGGQRGGNSQAQGYAASIGIEEAEYSGRDRSSVKDNSKSSASQYGSLDSVDQHSQVDSHLNKAGPAFGDKIVIVKVPSAAKPALLNKWSNYPVSLSPSDTYQSRDSDKPATGAIATSETLSSGIKSNSRIQSKRPTSSSKTSSGSASLTPVVKLDDYRPVSHSKSTQYESSVIDGATYPISSEEGSSSSAGYSSGTQSVSGEKQTTNAGYGQRYLEKVRKDQASARNETLGPEVCVRAGLFRHPADCQKFYECYWDRWIHQFTVHIFKCPVQLVYDEYITACNWPFDGPACVPHETIKLYVQPDDA